MLCALDQEFSNLMIQCHLSHNSAIQVDYNVTATTSMNKDIL